jgi:hypothetical protein
MTLLQTELKFLCIDSHKNQAARDHLASRLYQFNMQNAGWKRAKFNTKRQDGHN